MGREVSCRTTRGAIFRSWMVSNKPVTSNGQLQASQQASKARRVGRQTDKSLSYRTILPCSVSSMPVRRIKKSTFKISLALLHIEMINLPTEFGSALHERKQANKPASK